MRCRPFRAISPTTSVRPIPFTGRYTLRGLTPGASYAVYVDELDTFRGQIGFSTPPRTLPGPEEFYNGALESNNSATDAPDQFTPIVALAGVTVGGINIIFNRLEPGPIPVGDETSTEIFPKFQFKFCGEAYDSVFVNSNGNLTFGGGRPRGVRREYESASGRPAAHRRAVGRSQP